MEELQDAIEDAQYVNAICTAEDGPRPVVPWPVPEEEELAAWKARVVAAAAKEQAEAEAKAAKGEGKEGEGKEGDGKTPPARPEPFGFEWTLSHALGFFLFAAYLKEDVKEHVEINFMELVIQWKASTGRFKAKRTSALMTNYLAPLTEDERRVVAAAEEAAAAAAHHAHHKPPPASTEATASMAETDGGDADDKATGHAAAEPPRPPRRGSAVVLGPVKREITQHDLRRAPRTCHYAPDELREIRACGDATRNYVRVGGTVLEKIRGRVKALQKHDGYTSLRNISEEPPKLPTPEDLIQEALAPSKRKVPDPDKAKINEGSLRAMSLISNELPANLFDKAEVLVAENVRERHWAGFLRSEHHKKLLHFLFYQDKTVVEEDFFVMRVLGRGGFGLVTACKKGTSGKLYAMKVMNKKRIKLKRAEQLTLNEQKCLADVNSPFVVNLKYSFQSPMDVFLILDLMTGGDLSFHLSQRRRFREEECLYYGARIMLGLQALHDRGYVYRDLKPENCLLGEDGRVKLTDLGLAVKATRSLRGAAGTRGYWAPEMLRRDAHGKRTHYNRMVDWFSFGCMLAEFISGDNPFRTEEALKFGLERAGKDKDAKDAKDKKSKVSIFSPTERAKDKRRQQEKAIDCATLEMHPKFEHEKFDEDSRDLCRLLLDKNAHTRLGKGGAAEIRNHPYFRQVDWEEIISDRATPPFVPRRDVNAASQSEIGTFPEDKAFHQCVLDEKDEKVYESWNFTNSTAFAAEVIEFLIYERETGRPLLPIQQGDSCCCTII